MDVQTALVYVGVVVASAAVIVLISMCTIREKSYEEAIAEQRKLPDDLLLSKKDKSKEKKHKNKAGKKVKEKKEEKDEKEEKEEKPEHVQFEEVPQILPSEPLAQEGNKGNKKKAKPEKVKPILVNKDEPLVIVNELSSSQPLLAEANHFDVLLPKDDLELIRSHSKENLQQATQSESSVNKSPKETPTKSKKNAKEIAKKKEENVPKEEKKDSNVNVTASATLNKEEKTGKEVKDESKETPVKEVKEPVKESVKENIVPLQSVNKESKKTKKKNDILAQIGGDKDGVNVSLLIHFIQKAELSRSEIQMLIEQLFNKELDNPSEHSEWTEGRADPVIKLKKQLAEKEKALTDEHEASVALQNKLKELRVELNSERSRLSANLRQLEEALHGKNTEAQNLQMRMQHILENHAAEKQSFARQIEQLQTKVNEDAAIIHKLQEDQGAQGHLQQELMTQRKQMELQFTQMRENENALKAQIAQKHGEVEDLQNELQMTCDSSTDEIDMLRQQLGIMQGQLMHSEGQLQHFKEAGDRLQDVTRQLEESRHAQADLDHRVKSAHRHEVELQKQLNALQSELNTAKAEAKEVPALKSELSTAKSQIVKLEAEVLPLRNALTTSRAELDNMYLDMTEIIAEKNNLEESYDSLQRNSDAAKAELEKTKDTLKQTQEEILKYQNELQKARQELIKTQEELANAHAQINAPNEAANELKMLKIEMDRLQANEKKSSEVQLHVTRLQEENDRLSAQFADVQKEINRLHDENETLKSQLVTINKQSEAGRENGVEDKAEQNTIQLSEHTHILSQKESQLDALKAELTYKEAELSQLHAQMDAMRSDVNNQHNLARQLQSDLEAQRLKNNELRTKNWKVMEALSAAESRVKSNSGKSIDEVTQKVITEQEELTKAFLQRVFPEIKVSEKSYDRWLSIFEDKINNTLNELKKKNILEANSELEKQNKNLQGMVSHYKQIVEDTEGMLHKLQTHIESEETRWQAQLRQKENEVANLRVELHDIRNKLSVNEKLQEKVSQLEARLADAASLQEEAKNELAVLKTEHKSLANTQSHSHELVALEKLQEEKARLSEQLETESRKRAILDAEVSKLRSLVETSEASLAQEKNLVVQLQQEVSQLKNEICGVCSSSEQSMLNGPPTSESPNSEPPLAAHTVLAALENTFHKNQEFANCSIAKSVNLVQSQQEIDNSPLTSKHSSKSCHMTDHNKQASCRQLIGQQQKKNKKKRKSTKKPTAKRRRFAGWFKKKVTSKNKLR